MPNPLRLLSRSSPLALLQVDEVTPWLQRVFPDAVFERVSLETIGDRDLNTSLTDPSVPADFFTRELDRAQIEGRADIGIHSAKDLPVPLPEGITLAAMLPARDTRDALCVRPGVDLEQPFVIGTSSPVREAEVLKLYPQAGCRPIRGSIGQRLEQVDNGSFDAVLIAGCALQRLGMEDRITQWMDYETTPLQGRLALTVSSERKDLIAALRAIDVRRTAGLVALVGCPAEVRLLGGQARALIEAADIVLHDRLIPEEIIASLGDRGEYVGKKGHSHSTTQAHIHRRILEEAEQGRLVVRLHGGEPGILGHLGETLDYCASWNLRTEVVPAVSAAQITAARAQCSLTHRHEGSSITFLTGHRGLEDQPLEALSPERGHLAIYMGVRDMDRIRARLLEAGWPPSTGVISGQGHGSPQEQMVYHTLETVSAADLASPAVLLVGPRAHPPSFTLFTGTDPGPFLRHGPLLHLPMIALHPRPLEERVKELPARLEKWDGIVFPSSRAVEMVFETLMELGDVRLLSGKHLLAVGPMTARALNQVGLRAEAAPSGFGGVSALVNESGIAPGVYGYPSSDLSPVETRQRAVTSAGISLDPWLCYENRPTRPEHLPSLPFHRVLFTSASTARAYFDRFPEERTASREWCCVGTSTRQALDGMGVPAEILSS